MKNTDLIYTALIFIILLFFMFGFEVHKYMCNFEPEIKTEEYYQEKSSELYKLAIDYLECNNVKKKLLKMELIKKIKAYNSETQYVRVWKYHCPKHFTFEYLTGENDD